MCRIMSLLALLTSIGNAMAAGKTARAIEPFVRMPFASTLKAEGVSMKFARGSEATYFDIEKNRIATVPAGTPRFVPAPTKRWGAPHGLLLEVGAANMLLDSSFEGDLSPWRFTGIVEKRAKAGVHGAQGLAVKGPATIAHQAIALKTPPSFNSYILSIYARRADGGELRNHHVRCLAAPGADGEPTGKQYAAERLGNGPWYRLCARFTTSGQGPAPYRCLFKFARGEYVVDAAQLEYEWARSGGPSAYIPTAAATAKRSAEKLSCDVKELLPKAPWSYSFWSYAYPNTRRNGYIFAIRDAKQGNLMTHRRGDISVGAERIRTDFSASLGWLHVTVTYDGKRMDYFLNGVSDHSRQGPFEVDMEWPAKSAARWALGWGAPMGLIADFATWNRALSPEEVLGLYHTGKPTPEEIGADETTGIPIAFTARQSGGLSLNIFDGDGRLVHQLARGKKSTAGHHKLYWDGCNDEGRPVPPGPYHFKGLVSNMRSVWDGKVDNTSPSPGYGHLQYRTGHYSDVLAMPDGGLITCSFWGEASRVMQRIDGTDGYPVRWASSYDSPWPAFCMAAASDGTHLYAIFSRFAKKKKDTLYREVLTRWSLEDGLRSKNFEIELNAEHEPVVPTKGWPGMSVANHDGQIAFAGVCGLACRKNVLYIPYRIENRVALFDLGKVKEVASYPCPAPRRIAVDAQGRVLVTSANRVLRLDKGSGSFTPLIKGLDSAWGIAVGPKGNLFVTESGKTHQVKVFGPEGRLLKVFGRKGGHQGGRVSPDLLEMPIAVAVNEQGHVFVADLGGKRVLALNADFSLRKIMHGRMTQHCATVSNLDPSLFYTFFSHRDLWEYKIDYATGVSRVNRRWFYRVQDLPMGFGKVFFLKRGGRTFIIWPAQGTVMEIAGDKLIARVVLSSRLVPAKPPKHKLEAWVWRDRNGDGLMQKSEYEYGDWPSARTYHDGHVDSKGNMYIPLQRYRSRVAAEYRSGPGILKVPYEGLDENGVPKYHWKSAKWVLRVTGKEIGIDGKPYEIEASTYMEDSRGDFYVSDCGNIWGRRKEFSIRKYTADGKLIWKVGQRRRGRLWRPGDIVFCDKASGLVDDRYLFYVDYEGPINCWDTDGLWVGRLFADLPEKYRNQGECFAGTVFRHPNGKVYAFSAPDCTYRISRIVVEGLETMERFEGVVTVKTLAAPRKMVKETLPPWSILRTRGDIKVDGEIGVYEWGTNTDTQAPVDFEYSGRNVARSWAQWDDRALYIAWRIKDESPAVNKVTGSERWGADQVELMIRAAPGLDTSRGIGKHTASEYQLEIGPDGDGRVDAYVILNGSDRKGKFLPGARVRLVVAPDKSGYTMEASIPWASLGPYRPSKGDKIRWNMKIHWGAPDGGGVAYLSRWAPGHHTDPRTWGVAVFE